MKLVLKPRMVQELHRTSPYTVGSFISTNPLNHYNYISEIGQPIEVVTPRLPQFLARRIGSDLVDYGLLVPQ